MDDRFNFRTPIYGADGKFKKFVYWPAVYGAPAVTCREGSVFKNPEQCSAVRDKNGCLIYEGDIINLKDNDFEEKYVIEFDKDSACFCCVIRNRTSNVTIEWVPFADVIPLPIYADVVGNIHENPELLEVKNERKTEV